MIRTRTVPEWPIDLPSETVELVTAETWAPDYSAGPRWYDRPNVRTVPETGDTWSYGDISAATRETASHVVIRHASYSDYSGSAVEASNYRSLLRDFPDTFVTLYGGHGTTGLLLPVGNGRPDVLEAIAALAEYPLYDEDDMSALEMDWSTAAVTDYLRRDLELELEREGRQGEADAMRETSDDDVLRFVGDYYSDASEYPYAEAVESVVFPGARHGESELREYVVDRVLTAWAASIAGPSAGQTLVTDEIPWNGGPDYMPTV